MDVVTVTFLAIGGLALLLLVLSLIGGHLHLGGLHVGHVDGIGDAGGGLQLTLPAIAGFLGAFGFGGAIVASLVGGSWVVASLAAVVVGLCLGIPVAVVAARLMDAAVNIHTDATPTSHDLVGTSGVVVTPVSVDAYGEVRLSLAGQQVKVNARADQPLPYGSSVFVVEVLSPTSVLVELMPGTLRAPAEKEGK